MKFTQEEFWEQFQLLRLMGMLFLIFVVPVFLAGKLIEAIDSEKTVLESVLTSVACFSVLGFFAALRYSSQFRAFVKKENVSDNDLRESLGEPLIIWCILAVTSLGLVPMQHYLEDAANKAAHSTVHRAGEP